MSDACACSTDLVVMTGDLVDGSAKALSEAVSPLARVGSTYGNFFVTGKILLQFLLSTY